MDRKIKVTIDACLPRMVTAETIYNDYGAVIVWENTILDNSTINRLKDFGVNSIRVFESSLPQNQQKEPVIHHKPKEVQFTDSYEQNMESFKAVLYDLSAGKTVSIEKTIQIADSVYSNKDQNRDIIDCITKIRKVDEYTYYHCVNVSMLSMLLAKWLKLNADDIHLIVQAGLLHDIGKSRVPTSIINKPSKLTENESAEMKKHSEYGYFLVQYMEGIDRKILEGILYHHEREDGSGYPMGLRGDQIPLFAKILAVADTFDAMTANRSYKQMESPFKVFELMQNGCFGYLDPIVLNTFLSNISHYYVGSNVELSDGRIAEVIYINKQQFGKPVLKVGGEYLDMLVAKNIKIEKLVS